MKALLAIDGSHFSEAAARELIRLRPDISEVLVLEVVEPYAYSTPPQMSPGYAPEEEELLKEERNRAKEAVSRASEELRKAGFKATGRVIEAETRTGILDAASEWKADLIVVGSHGRKGVRRFLLGSVAESVARNAPCSVLVVRTAAAQ